MHFALGLVPVLLSQSPLCIPVRTHSREACGFAVSAVRCMQHAYLLTVACVLAAQAEVGRLDVFVDYAVLVDMLQSCQHASSILHKVVAAARLP